ncbi:MAG: hypothetical protein WD512_16510 [Candidatus Paceibacterota bacterium]
MKFRIQADSKVIATFESFGDAAIFVCALRKFRRFQEVIIWKRNGLNKREQIACEKLRIGK